MTDGPHQDRAAPTGPASAPPDRGATRGLRRSLARRLILVALLATLVVGVPIFFEARALLTNGIQNQLRNGQASQARAIAGGLEFVGDSVSVIARDAATVQSLSDFAVAFDQLSNQPDLLDAEETRALETYYRTVVIPTLSETGLPLPTDPELLPRSEAARYLQYHYLVTSPFQSGDGASLVEAAADESAYAEAHIKHHPSLDQARRALGFSDLILLDANGTIVYSAQKRTDLGRNLDIDTLLGIGITSLPRRLAAAAIGEPVLVDFAPNPAADGAPTLLGAAALYGPEGTIGAVVVEIPISALNRITTANAQWSQIGLGETGETYVVGQDLTMRSDSRLWLEDPAAYLDTLVTQKYPDELGESIARFGTTVLLQPVDTKPVATAFDGERFTGRARDYLGRPTLSVSERIDNDQLNWVVVAEISTEESGQPLSAYIRRLLITAAILVPLVGLAGLVLADRFTRPFAPVVETAARMAGGDLDVDIANLGSNEVSDVARRLTDLAAFLRQQDQTLAEEELETARLLRSVLPERLVERFRSGDSDIDDVVDNVTAVAITVTGLAEDSSVDPDTAAELGARVSHYLEEAAAQLGLERVRSSAGQHVFLSGLDQPTIEGHRAAHYAFSIGRLLERFVAETGVTAGYRIGMSSGKVISGLLESDLLTYGVFGEPPQAALVLASVAAAGQILVDRQTADELEDAWLLEPVSGLVDLRGEAIDAMSLVGDPSGSSALAPDDASLNPVDPS